MSNDNTPAEANTEAPQAAAPTGAPEGQRPANGPKVVSPAEAGVDDASAAAQNTVEADITPATAAFAAITGKPKCNETLNTAIDGLSINALGVLRASLDQPHVRLLYAAKADDAAWQRAMRTVASRLCRELDERHGKRANLGPLYAGQSALGTLGGEIGIGTDDGRRTALGIYLRAEHIGSKWKPTSKSAMSADLGALKEQMAAQA